MKGSLRLRIARRARGLGLFWLGLSPLFSVAGCERPDQDAALACEIFRETVCARVVECGQLSEEECEAVVFVDAPSCAAVLASEGDLGACNDALAQMECAAFEGFAEDAVVPDTGPCAEVRYVFPR